MQDDKTGEVHTLFWGALNYLSIRHERTPPYHMSQACKTSFGLFQTKKKEMRKNWWKRHIDYSYAFYRIIESFNSIAVSGGATYSLPHTYLDEQTLLIHHWIKVIFVYYISCLKKNTPMNFISEKNCLSKGEKSCDQWMSYVTREYEKKICGTWNTGRR